MKRLETLRHIIQVFLFDLNFIGCLIEAFKIKYVLVHEDWGVPKCYTLKKKKSNIKGLKKKQLLSIFIMNPKILVMVDLIHS